MSGRTAVALCLAAFFATAAADTRWEWITSAWSALAAAVEEPSAPSSRTDGEPENGPGWLVDPNG